jgi:ribosomal protein S18 acetylase RimI-like enzyme
MWSLAVAEKYRRQGIASELTVEMERRLKSRGVEEVWGFVDVTNLASQALLAKFGYETNPDHQYLGPYKEL